MSTLKPRNFRDTARTLVTSPDELPDFEAMTREQEAEWWETHDVTDDLFDEGPEIDAEVYEALGIPDPKAPLNCLVRVDSFAQSVAHPWYNQTGRSRLGKERDMSKTEEVRARIDPATKEAAEDVFAKLGLSPSEAVRLFYRQVELYQGFPFELRIPNEETLQAIRDLDERRELTSFDSLEGFSASLYES